jgi:hypothetical protein
MLARTTDFSPVSRLPPGTLIRSTSSSELTIAYQDKPTVILEHTGGWSDRIREVAHRGKHLDESGSATLHFATTPEEAVEEALAPCCRSGRGAEGRREGVRELTS